RVDVTDAICRRTAPFHLVRLCRIERFLTFQPWEHAFMSVTRRLKDFVQWLARKQEALPVEAGTNASGE
ncbi:MAG TPA: hypothetical protein VGY53_08470, partial [Isosphaeraceae bacterium]|nr:hypothetical protein [Isosphaeraceae bacterium]